MSNPFARVVSVACLLAASIAAQTPTSTPGSTVGTTPAPIHGGGAPWLSRTSAAAALLDAPRESWSLARFDARLPQDTDYSLRGMFQNAHGEFMASRGRYEPMASVSAGIYPNQQVRHEPGSFDLMRLGFDADLPLVLSSEGYLLVGAYAGSRDYQFSDSSALSDENLSAVGMKFGFGAFLDENMLLEVETHPGAFTDADGGLHHQDFDFPSHALLTMRTTDFLYLKAGVRYNQVYKDAPWLPYLGMSWNITGMVMPEGEGYEAGTWRLDVLLPEYIELSYWPSGDTGFQFGFEVDGAQYHVRTSATTGSQRANVQVQEVTSYLGFVHRFSDTLSLSARGGAVLAGDYEFTSGASGFNTVEGALDQGVFATVSLGIDW